MLKSKKKTYNNIKNDKEKRQFCAGRNFEQTRSIRKQIIARKLKHKFNKIYFVSPSKFLTFVKKKVIKIFKGYFNKIKKIYKEKSL